MRKIILLDTSVYLNILNVPDSNQDRNAIFQDFEEHIKNENIFLLPIATIWETGNHIADLSDGGNRYKFAKILVDDVLKAFKGDSPYWPTYLPEREVFLKWLIEFPEYAKTSKSDKKYREGISLADLSIIKEWQRTKSYHNMYQVLIWSLDRDLQGYNHIP